jgi:hypothetical protein
MNPGQEAAVKKKYLPLAAKYGAPIPIWPSVPPKLVDDDRLSEILSELKDSKAKIVILLGDQPVKWFLRLFSKQWRKLDDFGSKKSLYGRLHEVQIDGVTPYVLPLAHPRQVAKLGKSSEKWFRLHNSWETEVAPLLI